jgi:hypothetical protein
MGAEKDLTEQRELLAAMRRAEKLNLRGQVEEARALCDAILEHIEGREIPVALHLRSAVARLFDTMPGPGCVREDEIYAELNPGLDSAIRALGHPAWSTENPWRLSRLLVTERGRWRCRQKPAHPEWVATVWEVRRGRPCPTCLAEAGLEPDAWKVCDYMEAPLREIPTPTYG